MNTALFNQTVSTDQSDKFDISALEVDGDLVNLTKLAKLANKRLDVWLKSNRTQRFLEAFMKVTPNGGIQIKLGRDKEQGTFAHRKIALKFAEWVSVDFEIWVNQQIDTLLQTGKVNLQPIAPQDYPSALRALATQYEVNQMMEKQLEHKQAVIVDLAENVPAKKMRTVINEVVRAYAHGEGVLYNYVWNRLYKEFKSIYHIDLNTRAKHRDQSKIDIAEDIGQLENLYLLALKMFEL